MGNENIYMLTNNEDYALRIELEDFEGNKRSISMKPQPLLFSFVSVFYSLESRELIF
jgi:Fibrinogen beta and gamma chains, C-terminal globular domain